MKRILIMDTGSFRVFGGAAKTAYDSYRYFRKRGYVVDVFADLSRIDKRIRSVSIENTAPGHYDAVLLNSIRDVTVVAGYLKPGKSKTRFIYTDRGNVIQNFRQAGWKKVLPKMMARQSLMMKMKDWLDCYVALSADQYEQAGKFFGRRTAIKFIPNWYAAEFGRIGSVRKSDSAVYVGRLDERQKRVSFLIEGVARVIKEHAELRKKEVLRIVGNGPNGEEYGKAVERLGIANNIRFHGFVSTNELVRLYNEASFFVSNAEGEGMRGPFVDATACGRPLLITASNNPRLQLKPPRSLVMDGSNGLIYKHGDLSDFSGKFYTLISDSALRRKLAKRSLAFSKRFGMEKNLSEYRKLVEGC